MSTIITNVKQIQERCMESFSFPSFEFTQSLTPQVLGFGNLRPPYQIAVFTGSFDPPHQGHMDLVCGILEAKKFVGMILIPAVGPSKLKPDRSSIRVRYPLVDVFCQEVQKKTQKFVAPVFFKILPEREQLENTRAKACRASQRLLKKIKERGGYPVRILGLDMVEQEISALEKGSEANTFFSEILLVSRSGYFVSPLRIEHFQRLVKIPVQLASLLTSNVSSDRIRTLLRKETEKKISSFLSPSVYQIVVEKGLYQFSSPPS